MMANIQLILILLDQFLKEVGTLHMLGTSWMRHALYLMCTPGILVSVSVASMIALTQAMNTKQKKKNNFRLRLEQWSEGKGRHDNIHLVSRWAGKRAEGE